MSVDSGERHGAHALVELVDVRGGHTLRLCALRVGSAVLFLLILEGEALHAKVVHHVLEAS